ncbi:hypothetical protein [Anaeromicropila populeti]|uniref:Uncharacterized protein n=1 Tax=Anaeromicropila populeti TaxID=37658 RepID=A0A1I6IMS6_9FIRM|nr:hypothetical protein [Anaeromicropila populeti]SFR68018.1 hypothetical protein SAMN05661086_00916 [Anaeromicropila populeti]
MTSYTLDVKHNGTDYGNFCIYQTYDGQDDDIRSLVWFSKAAHPGTQLRFEWNIDYSFVWSEKGVLIPGVIFNASEVEETDPSNTNLNTIGFTKDKGAYHFTSTEDSTKSGKLGIACSELIPANSVSIGIGMSGNPAYACVAAPSLKYTFSPHPTYWIAFGNYEEGAVIDVNCMTQKYAIKFPVNTFERSLQLCPNNTWGSMDNM